MDTLLAGPRRTRWGGLVDPGTAATGFFRTERLDNVWWLVDPDGGLFLSKGVDTVRLDQDRVRDTTRLPYAEACLTRYGSPDAWRAAAAARLAGWGVNTLGAWSDEAVAGAGPVPLAYAPNLDIGDCWGATFEVPGRWGDPFPDPFEPGFAAYARGLAAERCGPHCDDPAVLGWFTDNELRWAPDWRGTHELLTLFLHLEPGRAGRGAAVALLRSRYGDFAAFERFWRTGLPSWAALAEAGDLMLTPFPRKPLYDRDPVEERALNADPARAAFVADCDAFAAEVAERYFAVTAGAVRAAAPHHLVLGCRFAFVPQPSVIAAAGRHLDVISFNCYVADPIAAIEAYATTGRPGLIGEFSFRADDAGLPNSRGAAPRLPTQAERATALRRYVTAAVRHPSLVGYHWFEHADQPAEGRPDGEDSNYGTVTIRDEVYAELTRALTDLNGGAEALHRGAIA